MAAKGTTRSRAKQPAKQGARSVMVIQRHLYGADQPDEVIEGEIQIFETTPASVAIQANVTKNLGNYESLKLGVILTVPCYTEDLDATADNVAASVSERLDKEVEQYMNGGDVGPEEGLEEEEGEPDVDEAEPEVEDDTVDDTDTGEAAEDDELAETDMETEDGEPLFQDSEGNLYTLDEDGGSVLYQEAEAGSTEVEVPAEEEAEAGEEEYTEDGLLIEYDDEGYAFVTNEDGEVEYLEEEAGEEEGDEEGLEEEELDPEPEPPAPKRSAARNPRSSRRGKARGRS